MRASSLCFLPTLLLLLLPHNGLIIVVSSTRNHHDVSVMIRGGSDEGGGTSSIQEREQEQQYTTQEVESATDEIKTDSSSSSTATGGKVAFIASPGTASEDDPKPPKLKKTSSTKTKSMSKASSTKAQLQHQHQHSDKMKSSTNSEWNTSEGGGGGSSTSFLRTKSILVDFKSNVIDTTDKIKRFKTSSVQSLKDNIHSLKDEGRSLMDLSNSNWEVASKVGKRLQKKTIQIFQTCIIPSIPIPNDETLVILSVFMVSLLGTSIGFKSYLYFVTVGQSLSIALMSFIALIAFNTSSTQEIPILTNVQSLLVFFWSIRLTCFLLHREYISWPQRHQQLVQVHQKAKPHSKRSIWLTCASFYAMMFMPCMYRLKDASFLTTTTSTRSFTTRQGGGSTTTTTKRWGKIGIIGILFQSLGLTLEGIADYQKGTFKAQKGNRDKWCHVGLWQYSTHPNYLGEILFWIGTYLGSVACYTSLLRWAVCTVGLLFTFVVMKSAIDSLDSRQVKTYGLDEDFLEYRSTHSIFGPFQFSSSRKEKSITL